MDSIKRTILINGNSFTYEEERLEYGETKPMSHDEAQALLIKVNELLQQVGLPFYLGYGTLLGAVRNHDIIPGDEDLDIIVKDEALLMSSLPFLSDNGLKTIRICKGSTYSFRLNNNSYIDIYIQRPIQGFSPWKLYCDCLCGFCYTPRKLMKEYQEIEFLGNTYWCYKNPERILEFWYGKNWRVPVRGHNFIYEVKSHWIWMNIVKPSLIIGIGTIIGWPYWRHTIRKKYEDKESSIKEWKTKKNRLKKHFKLLIH